MIDLKTVTATVAGITAAIDESYAPSEVESGEPLVTHVGFKFGQTGTFSTMEISCTATSHVRQGDVAHRTATFQRDIEWALLAFESVKEQVNAARGSLRLSQDWSPLSGDPGPATAMGGWSQPDLPQPGAFAPPPAGIVLPPAAVVPSPVPPPHVSFGWPQGG